MTPAPLKISVFTYGGSHEYSGSDSEMTKEGIIQIKKSWREKWYYLCIVRYVRVVRYTHEVAAESAKFLLFLLPALFFLSF